MCTHRGTVTSVPNTSALIERGIDLLFAPDLKFSWPPSISWLQRSAEKHLYLRDSFFVGKWSACLSGVPDTVEHRPVMYLLG
jgi:hypothetical protein